MNMANKHFQLVFGSTSAASRRGAGFSLMEVLLAVMILGIGLIMVAAVFPVGATWTRQNAEETVAGIVARNAVSIIQSRYTQAGLSNVGNLLIALPGINDDANHPSLPLSERAYDFGRNTPYPCANPSQANYYWTALIRQSGVGSQAGNPGVPVNLQHSYDLYVLVFRKGDIGQQFSYENNNGELADSRNRNNEIGVPYVAQVTIANMQRATPTNPQNTLTLSLSGSLNDSSRSGVNQVVGSQVVLQETGQVFRVLSAQNGSTLVVNSEPPIGLINPHLLYVPAADGTTVSPLVYVYQTTISF